MLIVGARLHSTQQYFTWWIFFSFNYDTLSSYLFQSILFASLSIHLFKKKNIYKHRFFPSSFLLMSLEVEDELVLSALAVCILHIASSQRKSWQNKGQVQPVLSVPGLFSAWKSPKHLGDLLTLTKKTGYRFIWINVTVKNENQHTDAQVVQFSQ